MDFLCEISLIVKRLEFSTVLQKKVAFFSLADIHVQHNNLIALHKRDNAGMTAKSLMD